MRQNLFPIHLSGCFLIGCLILAGAGCRTLPQVGVPETRRGDEIVAAGQFFHVGTPVVLWLDPGGYDAYRVERRFGPEEKSGWETSHAEDPRLATPNRFGLRSKNLSTNELERVRGGGWDLPLLQRVVDQFVIHYDDAGDSRKCFMILQDQRGLSVHFLLDLDGTIYQTLDLKERAWHATTSNDRSIGVEIANLGAYPIAIGATNPFDQWYKKDASGKTVITLPPELGDGGLRVKNFIGRPIRPEPVRGNIQGQDLVQYDYTPEQYAALIKLTAALCKIFPKIECHFPADSQGRLIPYKLPDEELLNYSGVLGHFHIQTNKIDPGPAFQWNLVIDGARQILSASPAPAYKPLTRLNKP